MLNISNVLMFNSAFGSIYYYTFSEPTVHFLEYACTPCSFLGSQAKDMFVRWIGNFELPVDVIA